MNVEVFVSLPFVEDAWSFYCNDFLNVDKDTPWTTITIRGKHLPWINGDLKYF